MVVEDDAGHIPVGIVAIVIIVITIDHLAILSLGVTMLGNPVVHATGELLAVQIHTEEFRLQTHALVHVVEGAHLGGYVGIVGQGGCLAPSEVVVVLHLHVILDVGGLGGDQDHTEGCTRTVDRGRSSILEDADALDIGSVQVTQVVGGNTVNDVQRGRGTAVGQRTDTTDHDRSLLIDTTIGVQDGQAGHGTLQRLGHVGL